MTWSRSRLVALVMVIACVALATIAVDLSKPRTDYAITRGTLGKPVPVEGGALIVEKVQVGTQLSRNGEITDTTPGMFVVVTLTAAATGSDQLVLSEERLLAHGGRAYDRYSVSGSFTLEAGFGEQVDVVFEVDPAAITDLTLEVWRTEIVHGYQGRVQVHLGITDDNAAGWREAAAGQAVEAETNSITRALT